MRALALLPLALLAAPLPAHAQELPVGQSEADYFVWLASNPGHRGQILSFESWQEAAGVRGVLPAWQLVRTASMWRECGGAPFEIPPFRLWFQAGRSTAARTHASNWSSLNGFVR